LKYKILPFANTGIDRFSLKQRMIFPYQQKNKIPIEEQQSIITVYWSAS
jgi:hypothetical protein